MLKIKFVVISAFALIILGVSAPGSRKRAFDETLRIDYRLGIHIANDFVIQKYENEHETMYKKEDGTVNEDNYIEWPRKLGDKNLTEYCKKYLKIIIPKRNICGMFGEPEPGRIVYIYRSGVIEHNIGTIRCEVPFHNLSRPGKSYHITEAPEKDCVYTLTRINKGRSPFKIVFKVCGFESNDTPNSIYSNIRPKDRKKIVLETHKSTGIPIAPPTLIAKYENEHHKMHEKGDGSIDTDKLKAWPPNEVRIHLTNFCAKYLQAVIPNRIRREGLYGESDIFILQYTHIDWRMLKVGIVKCCDPPSGRKRPSYYYITESPEPDCVFTLLRTSKFRTSIIVYQFCGIRIGKYVEEGSETNRDNSLVHQANDSESKPDLNISEGVHRSKPSVDGSEDMEIKPDLKTLSFFSDD